MSPTDAPINWKRNLTVAWLGCFLTGAAFSLVMPFLPLYVEQLGVTGHSALNMWSGLVFSITFLFSAIASPFWGGLADRKGRKNYAAALRARHGDHYAADGGGAERLAVPDITCASGPARGIYP
jgi:Major Facilitator Superfamily.